MFEMELGFFNQEQDFPFFIQKGFHDEDFFPHIHKDFTELVIVLDGSATHVVGKDVYLVSKGDVYVVGSHTIHEYRECCNLKICNVMFQPEFFFQHTYQLKESPGFHALFYIEPYMTKEADYTSRLRLSQIQYSRVTNMIEEMMEEYGNQNSGWKEALQGLFMGLVVDLTRTYQMPLENQRQGILFVANAVSFIEKNYASDIKVEDIAKEAFLSERHLTRIFKETYHVTPMQYVIRLRLLYGGNLLRLTDKSVTEIAEMCGFEDNNYFARRFRQYYQMTPLEYRRFTREDRTR